MIWDTLFILREGFATTLMFSEGQATGWTYSMNVKFSRWFSNSKVVNENDWGWIPGAIRFFVSGALITQQLEKRGGGKYSRATLRLQYSKGQRNSSTANRLVWHQDIIDILSSLGSYTTSGFALWLKVVWIGMCLSDSGARGFFLSELAALSMFYITTDSDPVTCPLIDMSKYFCHKRPLWASLLNHWRKENWMKL